MKITFADFYPCLADFFCSVNGVWISELRSTFNFVKKKAVILPYYLSPHDLLLQQCCTQNGKRSIKGSLLSSRFSKCYGLVNDSSPSFVFNCSCNFDVNWLHERKNESKWKSFQRKTALKNCRSLQVSKKSSWQFVGELSNTVRKNQGHEKK